MNARTPYRLGALAMIAAAIGLAGVNLGYALAGITPSLAWLDFGTTALVLFSLVALYGALAACDGGTGLAALAGFILYALGLLAEAAQEGQFLAAAGDTATHDTLFTIARSTEIAGALLLGYAALRSGRFPRWAGALLLLIGVINPFTNLGGPVPYLYAAVSSLAWAALGWSLWGASRAAGGAQPRAWAIAPAR